ncbi:MarR family winged helix-turn-helix transcriptional regulator [Kitasatospora sp. NPDC002040]|uniref:MarR family winged helix-turn-helix transcriptional regulator n=1 Tax=Kitasatospora sp. NPDC002040 TaxID=3154661 RepID=UPI00332A64D1
MDGDAGWLDEREDEVWRTFFDMQVLFWRRLTHQLQQETGLSEPDFAILTALAKAPEGRLRPFELSGVIQFEKSRLHHQLTRMVGRGLVTRDACPDTSRGAVVTLSPQGRAAITEAIPRRAEHIRRWLTGPLDDGQLDALGQISATMLAALRTDGPDTGYDCEA